LVRHTPLETAADLSGDVQTEVRLKLENLQVTGSFKPRGSLNKLLKLKPKTGVIASTAGNHGIGVAFAAQSVGLTADIYLPESADPYKVAKLKEYGARLRFFETVEAARTEARATARRENLLFISAYSDAEMIAGGGTVALEILENHPRTDAVVVGVCGGGFAAGVAIAAKSIHPSIEIWGVQTENSPLMKRWLERGAPFQMSVKPSIAEGLAGEIELETITFPLLQRHLDGIILVSESEIAAAMRWGRDERQMIFEPSGAATVAALRKTDLTKFKSVVGVVTGGNVSPARFESIAGVKN
jgi:threonine dehydratase